MQNNNNNSQGSYQEAFFITPSYILHLPNITLGYLKVYATIFQFWNKGRACFLSGAALCERTGLCKMQVYKALNYFEKHNELERHRKNGKRYFVQPRKLVETDCPGDPPTEEAGYTPVDSKVHSSILSKYTPVDHNIKKVNKEKNLKDLGDSSNAPKKKSVDYRKDSRFMRFYEAYPRKTKPADAYKAFHQVIGDNDKLLERVIEDIANRISSHSLWADRQFIPYPASYLRSCDFDSEILNQAEETKQKKINVELENKKREAEQERQSQIRREQELEKERQYNQDGQAYRNICNTIKNRSVPPQEFSDLKESLRR